MNDGSQFHLISSHLCYLIFFCWLFVYHLIYVGWKYLIASEILYFLTFIAKNKISKLVSIPTNGIWRGKIGYITEVLSDVLAILEIPVNGIIESIPNGYLKIWHNIRDTCHCWLLLKTLLYTFKNLSYEQLNYRVFKPL